MKPLEAMALALAITAGSAAAGAEEPSPPRSLPVSLDRVRAALKKPEGLAARAEIPADFRVDIVEEQRFRDLLDLLDFGRGPAVPGGLYAYQQQQLFGRTAQPLFSVGLSGLGRSIGSAVADARRERAERLARKEVRRALDDFCAAHDCPVR